MSNPQSLKPSAFSRLKWKQAPLSSEGHEPERATFFLRESRRRNTVTADALAQLAANPLIPDAPEETTAKGKAIALLRVAAEIEHGLMAEYLYAYYTLNSAGKFWTEKQPINGKTHADDLLNIAIEEMGHLMTVQNLLFTLGADWHLDLQPVSVPSGDQGDFPFPYRLAPLTKNTLAKYVVCESPANPNDVSPGDRDLLNTEIEPLAEQEAGRIINHVGNLYLRLNWLFQRSSQPAFNDDLGSELEPILGPEHLADSDFDAAKLPFQTREDDWTSAKTEALFVAAVSGEDVLGWRRTARLAIRRVGDQGENAKPSDLIDSHFERLMRMYRAHAGDDVFTVEGRAPLTDPRLPGDPNGWGNPAEELGGDQIALDWARFFRLRYELLINVLALSMEAPPDSRLRQEARNHGLNSGMRNSLRTAARFLAQQPVGTKRFGPPFLLTGAIPERSGPADLLLDRVKQRARELIEESAPLRDKLNPPLKAADTKPLDLF